MPRHAHFALPASTAAALLLLASPALAAPVPLVDQTIPQTVGGAQVCVAEECLPELQGVRDVHLRATYDGESPGVPELESTSAPDCTANVDVAFRLRSGGIGPGTVHLLVEFDRTDRNGHVVPRSHTTVERDVLLPAGTPVEKDPLLSFCGTVLDGPEPAPAPLEMPR